MKKNERTIIVKAVATSQVEPAEILDYRTTPNGHIVLVFDQADVIMPGNYRLRRDLAVGDVVAAYWTDEADGTKKFHLEWQDQ